MASAAAKSKGIIMKYRNMKISQAAKRRKRLVAAWLSKKRGVMAAAKKASSA